MFILVEWILEGLFSVISFKSITSPRKEYEDYSVGEEVQARYQGKVYPAKIVKKSGKFTESCSCVYIQVACYTDSYKIKVLKSIYLLYTCNYTV
jgi:hypothetical protein